MSFGYLNEVNILVVKIYLTVASKVRSLMQISMQEWFVDYNRVVKFSRRVRAFSSRQHVVRAG
jgi:hypothetical protein